MVWPVPDLNRIETIVSAQTANHDINLFPEAREYIVFFMEQQIVPGILHVSNRSISRSKFNSQKRLMGGSAISSERNLRNIFFLATHLPGFCSFLASVHLVSMNALFLVTMATFFASETFTWYHHCSQHWSGYGQPGFEPAFHNVRTVAISR